MAKKVTVCCICGKTLDPDRPVTEERPASHLSDVDDWFYCLGCWYRMKSYIVIT